MNANESIMENAASKKGGSAVKSRTKKPNVHLWRMIQIVKRINEYNERRHEHMMSGHAQTHPEWFAKWESDELEKRKAFETLMQTATP